MNDLTLFDKYLQLLDVNQEPPSFDFLNKIVKSQLTKIPFENISKLLYKKRGIKDIPSLSDFLEGIQKNNSGGTCYSINYYLNLLLGYLGFDVRLCGADMKQPDVHIINIVTIDNREYIIDGGYAAPFFIPLPTDQTTDLIINWGRERYVIKPRDYMGRTRVEQHSNDVLQHWYTAKPQQRKLEEFRKVIEDSYSDDATFMNTIRIVRFTENGSVSLRNYTLIETNEGGFSETNYSREMLPLIIREKFGMPEEMVREAIDSLTEQGNTG